MKRINISRRIYLILEVELPNIKGIMKILLARLECISSDILLLDAVTHPFQFSLHCNTRNFKIRQSLTG
jgi:hypothetical protein